MSTMQTKSISDRTGLRSLMAGGLAALLASTCCLGPLVLIALGFSGAWISNLTVFQPYQPIFIAAALIALFLAGKRIWRPVAQCTPDEICSVPRVRLGYQILFVGVCALLLTALVFPLIAHWFY
jgi:mercuric ion transport protein